MSFWRKRKRNQVGLDGWSSCSGGGRDSRHEFSVIPLRVFNADDIVASWTAFVASRLGVGMLSSGAEIIVTSITSPRL